MTVVRISKGRVDPTNIPEAERLLAASEAALRGPLQQLHGLVHYYVGIDRQLGFLTNVSVWETGGRGPRRPDETCGCHIAIAS